MGPSCKLWPRPAGAVLGFVSLIVDGEQAVVSDKARMDEWMRDVGRCCGDPGQSMSKNALPYLLHNTRRCLMKLTLAFSPCPNDTFMFHGIAAGHVRVPGCEIEVVPSKYSTGDS